MILIVVFALAIFAAKSCASRDSAIDQDEAKVIAREAIDYEPERVMVRFTPRGFDSRPFWAVSLSTLDAAGNLDRVTVVVVDAETGEIAEIRRGR